MVPEEDVINLSISIEDAFKVLISGGIVSPKTSKPVSTEDGESKTLPQVPIETSLPELSEASKVVEETHQILPLEEQLEG